MPKYFMLKNLILTAMLMSLVYSQGLSRYGTSGFGEAQSPWEVREKESIFSIDLMIEEGYNRYYNESIYQWRAEENADFNFHGQDIMNHIGMGQVAFAFAKDWTLNWRSGLKQNMLFQTYKLKAEPRLDDRKGMSFSDLHYWDQFRFLQTKHFALGAMHEVFIPWFDQFKRGAITHYSVNPRMNRHDVNNLQSAGEFVQGAQLQATYAIDKLPHDLGTAIHINLGARYYWNTTEILPVAVLGLQARWDDDWVIWSTVNHTYTTSFEQGIRLRADKSRTIDFYIREAPFQDYEKFTWKEEFPFKSQTGRFKTRIQQEPKLLIGFKVAYSWSPRKIFKKFTNHYDYLDPQRPFATFGESYFIPSPVVGDSVPMPASKVYKGFGVDENLELTLDSRELLDSIINEMVQHPVRIEFRVAYGEASMQNVNERLGRLIGESIGEYMVSNGISKRRIRIKGQAAEGLEDWERVRLYTKVYSMPLEPPTKLVMPVNGVVEGFSFNRDGFLTEEGEKTLRHLSMQIEKFGVQVEIITRSNRTKDPKENLRLSKENAKLIGEFLVAAGVNPESLRFRHLGDKDIPETENELVEIIVATPQEMD